MLGILCITWCTETVRKSEGKGNKPNAADALESADIECMWSSGALGNRSPYTSANPVVAYCHTHGNKRDRWTPQTAIWWFHNQIYYRWSWICWIQQRTRHQDEDRWDRKEHKCRCESFQTKNVGHTWHTIQMPSLSVLSFRPESSTRYVYTWFTLLSCCQSPALTEILLVQETTSRCDSTQQDHERASWQEWSSRQEDQPLCSEDNDSDSVDSQRTRLYHHAAFWSQECQ